MHVYTVCRSSLLSSNPIMYIRSRRMGGNMCVIAYLCSTQRGWVVRVGSVQSVCVCVLCLSLCTISGNVVWVNMSECMCPCIRVWFRAVCVCVCEWNSDFPFGGTRRTVPWQCRSAFHTSLISRRVFCVARRSLALCESRVSYRYKYIYIIVVYIAFASVSRRAIRRFRVVLCLSRYWQSALGSFIVTWRGNKSLAPLKLIQISSFGLKPA